MPEFDREIYAALERLNNAVRDMVPMKRLHEVWAAQKATMLILERALPYMPQELHMEACIALDAYELASNRSRQFKFRTVEEQAEHLRHMQYEARVQASQARLEAKRQRKLASDRKRRAEKRAAKKK
jgi:hypothetical protein